MVRIGASPQTQKQSPWSSASEKWIDSLADWLIPTLGRPEDFTYYKFDDMINPPPLHYLRYYRDK